MHIGSKTGKDEKAAYMYSVNIFHFWLQHQAICLNIDINELVSIYCFENYCYILLF